MQKWSPSTWGRRFTGASDWSLCIDGPMLTLTVAGQLHRVLIGDTSPLVIHHGVFWTDLMLQNPAGPVVVDGIPNRHGADIRTAVDGVVVEARAEAARARERERKTSRRQQAREVIETILPWQQMAHSIIGRANGEKRYLTTEQVRSIVEARPQLPVTVTELAALLNDPDVRGFLGEEAIAADNAAQLWSTNVPRAARKRNETFMAAEVDRHQDLFATVEKSPLTNEQARAVVCFDNRVQVVASAGSGKTSTMVAKASYAITRGLIAPERIVLLAFNQAAAAELDERARKAFARIGLSHVTVEAKTFHALGSRIIGEATGKKRHVPGWATDKQQGIAKITQLVDAIRDRSPTFRTQWDVFRLVFGRDLPPFGKASPDEEWDPERQRGSLRTLRGEPVKSADEVVIANWLFYSGVDYRYERPYEIDTATSTHAQYRPDFFYPAINLYHEHFALDKHGNPPPEFKGYADGVVWKRELHAIHGTDLIETTSSQLWNGKLFAHLERELVRRGLTLDPDPFRKLPDEGQEPMEDEELMELMRSFICHAKGNNFDETALKARLANSPDGAFTFRHQLFLRLVSPVRKAWDEALAAERAIDFEDMLGQAADHVEAGRFESPYDLVLADEFQDASWARARLCLALVAKPGRHLFAVGDDWQSINRFAGADVSVMTGFSDWCGGGEVLRLETTFRCPQALCDAAGTFVSKNPVQIPKRVRSDAPTFGPVLTAVQVVRRTEIASIVDARLENLCRGVIDGTIPPGRRGKVSVFILGRYKKDRQYLPGDWRARFGRHLEISFTTIHASKGTEADYVILPGMVRGGFPSQRSEDPVLSLAMPGGDPFFLAEERRLLYVALTRARRSVAMVTVRGQMSVFLEELIKDGQVVVTDAKGKVVDDKPCPHCRRGVLIERPGQFGVFTSCSEYPRCKFKPPRKAVNLSRPRPRPAYR